MTSPHPGLHHRGVTSLHPGLHLGVTISPPPPPWPSPRERVYEHHILRTTNTSTAAAGHDGTIPRPEPMAVRRRPRLATIMLRGALAAEGVHDAETPAPPHCCSGSPDGGSRRLQTRGGWNRFPAELDCYPLPFGNIPQTTLPLATSWMLRLRKLLPPPPSPPPLQLPTRALPPQLRHSHQHTLECHASITAETQQPQGVRTRRVADAAGHTVSTPVSGTETERRVTRVPHSITLPLPLLPSLHYTQRGVFGRCRVEVLFYTPYRTALYRTAPHRTAPHRTAPHRTAPHWCIGTALLAPHRTTSIVLGNQHRTSSTALLKPHY
jgi:hypothetical protein